MLKQRFSTLGGSIWLNGEFGMSLAKRTDHLTDSIRIAKSAWRMSRLEWFLLMVHTTNWQSALKRLITQYPSINPEHLGLSLVPNSHTDTKSTSSTTPRGEKGITSHGKKLVRNAAKLLQDTAGRKHLSFLTWTLPDVSPRDAETIAENWACIVKVANQRLVRSLRRAGLPGTLVEVTEVQVKRFERTGVLCLHLHVVFQGRHRYRHWALEPLDFDVIWREVLTPYLERTQNEYNWEACSNVQSLRKSSDAYLGKYMSKGKDDVKKIREAGCNVKMPTSWYSVSTGIRRMVMKLKIGISQCIGEWLRECFYHCKSDVFAYAEEIRIDITNGWHPPMEKQERVIGWYGRLLPSVMEELTASVR